MAQEVAIATGALSWICVSPTKGTKSRVERAVLRADHGIEGDAHAGPWHRQVSLLDSRDVDAMREKDLSIEPGAFGENLCVRGIACAELGIGSRLRVGDTAELMFSQIGKVCHTRCEIFTKTGDCIMPRSGIFARVARDGEIASGDPVTVIERIDRALFQSVVLTVSDRCSRGEAEDTAGPAVARQLAQAGSFHVYRRKIVPDEQDRIEHELRHYSGGHGIDLVLTVGGTGFAPRDVTPEATRAVVERFAPGLDEAMRAASLAKTPSAMLSRGAAGIRRSTLIVNLPGSLRAATENLAVILPALPHALAKLRGAPSNCDPARGASRPLV